MAGNWARTGPRVFLQGTLPSSWAKHLAWIQNKLRHSTGKLSRTTMLNSKKFLICTTSPLKIYTIWMRRAVSKVEGGKTGIRNISYLVDGASVIRFRVQTWNLWQSLRLSQLMDMLSSWVLFLQGRNSVQDGLRLTQKLCNLSNAFIPFLITNSKLDFSISVSENGSTDDFIGIEWFQCSFIPQATAQNNITGKHILLIMDGHGSHETSAMWELALQHNIILFSLPPHTTHKLQPLDVRVFGLFARAWADRCNEVLESMGEEVSQNDFVRKYMAVWSASFKKTTIITAFRKTGISPFDPNCLSEHDFSPSNASSTRTYSHVPGSYPLWPTIPNPSDSNSEPARNFGDQKFYERWGTSDNEYSSDLNSDSDSNSNSEPPHHASTSTPPQCSPNPYPWCLPLMLICVFPDHPLLLAFSKLKSLKVMQR